MLPCPSRGTLNPSRTHAPSIPFTSSAGLFEISKMGWCHLAGLREPNCWQLAIRYGGNESLHQGNGQWLQAWALFSQGRTGLPAHHCGRPKPICNRASGKAYGRVVCLQGTNWCSRCKRDAGGAGDRRKNEYAAEIWNASRKHSELPGRSESYLLDPTA